MANLFWAFERRLLRLSKYFGPQQKDSRGQKPVAIITGASEGIGLSLAYACAELNLDLLLIARTEENLEAAKRKIAAEHDVEIFTLSANLAQPESVDAIVDTLQQNNLFPHLLINNVGIGLCGNFSTQPIGEITKLIDVNVTSWTALTHRLLPAMQKRKSGGIINISSLAGMVPGPYQAVYYASKAYMNSLSQALSQELTFSGIRVSAVAPGPVATGFHKKMGAERSAYLFVQNVLSPNTVARASIIWFALGRSMIVPGILNAVNSIFVKIMPNAILLWIMGVLLKRRGKVGIRDESS